MTRARATFPITFLVSLASFACTPTSATGSPPPATGGSGGHGSSYVGRPGPGQTDPSRPGDGTSAGHHFTPRPHEAHFAPGAAAPPILLSLPRYVDGSARCFASPEPVHAPYGPTYGHGYGRSSAPAHAGGSPVGGSHSGRRYGAGPSPQAGSAGGMDSANSYAPQPAAKAAPSPTSPPTALAEGSSAADLARPMPAPAPNRPSAHERRSERERDDRRWTPPVPPDAGGFGVPVYLSNDDTMSLSSAQRVMWAIDHFAPIPREHVRPHELLNYFSFQTEPVASDHDFSVMANIAALDQNQARLALSIRGRSLTHGTRRNVNLAYVVDRSGSMDAEGRMEYLKQGLLRSLDELKHGDIVHVTLFDTSSCQLAENFVVGRDDLSRLRSSISRIAPLGSTNLHEGLVRGYEVADRAYQPM